MVYNKRFVDLYMNLPDDIKIIIMEYNSIHRSKIKKSFDNILLKASIKRMNYITNIYTEDYLFSSQTDATAVVVLGKMRI